MSNIYISVKISRTVNLRRVPMINEQVSQSSEQSILNDVATQPGRLVCLRFVRVELPGIVGRCNKNPLIFAPDSRGSMFSGMAQKPINAVM